MRYFLNPHASREPYSTSEQSILSLEKSRAALGEFELWPGYAPTPLRSLTKLAHRFAIASLAYKDESTRFGLGSFKALGGAYAAKRALSRASISRSGGGPIERQGIVDGKDHQTLSCATDGNHGRSVAFAAKQLGCRCLVFMHEHAPETKAEAIRALGAQVIRTPGTYDESVLLAGRLARSNGWISVMDTSDDEFDETVIDVMNGYATTVLEICDQGPPDPPTHVFVQAGVGGLAAAVAATFAQVFGRERPTVVVVEPETAACVLECAINGSPVNIRGNLNTTMQMLSCGRASNVAWKILNGRADVFLAIEDRFAEAARDELVRQKIDAGVSGAAALGGLMAVINAPEVRAALAIDRHSRILVFGTEGEDPQ
jgi:diaminopropionate ammonia-lyase